MEYAKNLKEGKKMICPVAQVNKMVILKMMQIVFSFKKLIGLSSCKNPDIVLLRQMLQNRLAPDCMPHPLSVNPVKNLCHVSKLEKVHCLCNVFRVNNK